MPAAVGAKAKLSPRAGANQGLRAVESGHCPFLVRSPGVPTPEIPKREIPKPPALELRALQLPSKPNLPALASPRRRSLPARIRPPPADRDQRVQTRNNLSL